MVPFIIPDSPSRWCAEGSPRAPSEPLRQTRVVCIQADSSDRSHWEHAEPSLSASPRPGHRERPGTQRDGGAPWGIRKRGAVLSGMCFAAAEQDRPAPSPTRSGYAPSVTLRSLSLTSSPRNTVPCDGTNSAGRSRSSSAPTHALYAALSLRKILLKRGLVMRPVR